MAEPLPAAPKSREIRVFLSSTFRDFNEERRLLATEVFPRLNRQARERGVELVEVDLRWGVTQQKAEDGHTLEICLKQIERCKPYFIGMLGDSYGSITPPERKLLKSSPELLAERQWLAGRIGEASYTELEIEHSLQLLRDPAITGKAFFYFRDPAYSKPKAAAGEAGWRSDTPEDRQKLELLRQKIRDSGFPRTEGLKDPQAVVDQIEKDLWTLIDQQFPEGEQPDALEKEARKHADYRRSRTKPGQYVGGGAYIDQLERWIAEDQQQILITGESGAGKSALLANWIEAHLESHPEDVVYAHHLGCTNDANALRPLLGRLIDTASAQLLETEVITEALAVPEDWWELVVKVAETLQTLGRWCQQEGKRWIWVLDGIDRLDPDDQNALPWLPQSLPAGIHVVASALTCPARSILSERNYTTLTIEPLAAAEQEQLIQRFLQRYTKELDGGLRQQILNHPLAGSPLFLKVLLEELRQCGRHDTLKEQLNFYLSSETIDDLYERVLERLENDGSGDAVRKVMTAIWASRAGLAETELLEITDLAPLQWAPIDLALEKVFGRNGNRLVFDHDFLRIAVQDRYLPSEEQQRQAHSELAHWYGAQEKWDERKAEEWPWQLLEAERKGDLRALLLNVSQLFELANQREEREVINYWLAVKGLADGELDELIADAIETEIAKREGDNAGQILFINRIADLLDEAGLFRDLLIRMRIQSLDLQKGSDTQNDIEFLRLLAWTADAYEKAGYRKRALETFQQCLEMQSNLLGPEHPETLDLLISVAKQYRENAEYDVALELINRTLGVRERLLGSGHPDTLNTLNELGLLYSDKGEIERARQIYEKCLEIEEWLLGPEHSSTLVTINNLAVIYYRNGDYERAEAYYMRCLEAQERLFGSEHPITLTAINNLAMLYNKMNDYKRAQDLCLRCLIERERLLGPDHPSTLTTVGNMAMLLHQKGDYEQAETYYKRNLEASERMLGPEDLSTLITVNNLGHLYWDKGDHGHAEACFLRCLQARERLLGTEHPDTNNTRFGLANLLSDQGRYEEAIPLRRLELDMTAKRDGRDAAATLTSIHRLAADLYWSDELQESEQLYREALAGRITALGDDDDATMASRYGLAQCLSDQNRHDAAIELRRVELDWCRQQDGDTDSGTLASIEGLAIDLRETGELEEAEALFRELVTARQQVLEPEDFQIGRALRGLAKTLELAGKLEEALTYSQQALEHRQTHEGPDAWWTNRERLDLARVLHKLERNAEATALLQKLMASMNRNDDPDDADRQLLSDAEELMRALAEGF